MKHVDAKPSYPELLNAAWDSHCAPKPREAPAVVSLFAGAGGSALGFSMAGYRLRLAVENNADAAATLAAHFPATPLFAGDIRNLCAEQALRLCRLERGELDVLEASPPCQGFSRAGRRRPEDPRNGLLWEVPHMVRCLRPKTFVMENVDALLHEKGRPFFAPVFRALRDCGYRVGAWIINAAYYNVPQHRRRCIVIGLRADCGLEPCPPPPLSWPRPLCAALWDLPAHPVPETGHVWVDESPQGRATRTWRLAARAAQGTRYAGHQRRLLWNAPSPTLTASSANGRDKRPYLRNSHCHPLHTRTLSPAEYKRLASFPDAYRFAGEDAPAAWHRSISRVGNAVPPLFMRAVAVHVAARIASYRKSETPHA